MAKASQAKVGGRVHPLLPTPLSLSSKKHSHCPSLAQLSGTPFKSRPEQRKNGPKKREQYCRFYFPFEDGQYMWQARTRKLCRGRARRRLRAPSADKVVCPSQRQSRQRTHSRRGQRQRHTAAAGKHTSTTGRSSMFFCISFFCLFTLLFHFSSDLRSVSRMYGERERWWWRVLIS